MAEESERLMEKTPKADSIDLLVPGLPPSVNHSVKHSRGRHYRTKEADRFMRDVAIVASGRGFKKGFYRVEFEFLLGIGARGDLDNFLKCCLDGMVKAGVIHSDSAVVEISARKFRGEVSRTFIYVELCEAD